MVFIVVVFIVVVFIVVVETRLMFVDCCFDIEQVMWWDDHYEN